MTSNDLETKLCGTAGGKTPPGPVPVETTDLHALERSDDVVIWLGHSSYYVQLGGKRILIDPVLSANASPIPMTNEAFEGASPFAPEDIPDIDYLLISHDHWDHLDYPTLKALQHRIGQVIVGLGVGEHFRTWGFAEGSLHEADWGTTIRLDDELAIHVLPARHYSGRWLERNQSLWVSYALETEDRKIFFSGDSGYGEHFKTIGETFDGFDLVLLRSGWLFALAGNITIQSMSDSDRTRGYSGVNRSGLLMAFPPMEHRVMDVSAHPGSICYCAICG